MYGAGSGLYDRHGEFRRAILNGDRATVFRYYDGHNPGARTSTDVNERLFGKCGCGYCSEVRQKYHFGENPMNDQRRDNHNMGSVNMCERCGALMIGNAVGSVVIALSSDPDTFEQIRREICPGCVEDVLTLVEVKVAPKENGYRAPYKRPESDPKGLGELTGVDLEALLAEALQRAMQANRAIEGKSTKADE